MAHELTTIARNIPGYDPFATAGDCHFDEAAAQRVLDFFPAYLTHIKGPIAGQPYHLNPWEQAVAVNLFGWKRPDGTRRYREVGIWVGRKNNKSTFAAGLLNFVTFCDGEQGAECYCAAADRDQATLVYDPAMRMMQGNDALRKMGKAYATSRTVTFEERASFYKAISADANTKHGYNAHLVIIDELHAQPNRNLVDVLITSTGARLQPIIVYITTSDFERKSVCNEKLDYALKVRDGVVDDPAFLPVLYIPSDKDDWTSPDTWAKANPNLGRSISLEYLERECRRARDVPAYLNTFKRLHLNIKTEQATRWLSGDHWAACGHDVDDAVAWRAAMLDELAGQQCHAGLDLGSTSDVTALVLMFPRADEPDIFLPFFWIPEQGVQRKDYRYKELYETWIRQDFIKTTAGDVTDYDFIRKDINTLADAYGIESIAVDRVFQGAQLCTQLMGDGLELVSFGQGFFSMAAPTKAFEERVVGHALHHGNNPVLNWMADNAQVVSDPAGNIKPIKPSPNSPAKIDGIVAAIMALARASAQQPAGASVYETRGLITV